jgi:cytochrome c oxidase subunit 1
VAQTWLWLIGVLTFSRGQMHGGVEGMPRRTQVSEMTVGFSEGPVDIVDAQGSSWDWSNALTAIGGTIMFVSAALFFVVIIGTLANSKAVEGRQEIPIGEVVHGPRRSWAILDDIKIWALIAVVLTIIVYGEVIWHYWPINSVSEGFRVW